jgi:hypothetical protein
MGLAKLKIDINLGILEVEGDETFVQNVYADYKKSLFEKINSLQSVSQISETKNEKKESNSTSEKKNSKKKSQKASSGNGSILGDLDLAASANAKSLKDFYAQYKPTSQFEKNLIFVYYLANEKQEKSITLDHIYTCYKMLGERVPTALPQSLRDTAGQKGWIDTSNISDIKVTTIGDNFINHDIKKSNA